MNSRKFLLLLLVSFDINLNLAIHSSFLEAVRNSTLLHHKQTNTVWEHLGTYAQTEDTINFILEIPVFQFMCDVFPASMAFAMQACTQYRNRVLDNGSARRLNELFEAHIEKRDRRQIEEALVLGSAVYGGYKIVGDLFGGGNDEIVHRLDESENFQKHQEKLDDVMVTSILSLEDNNLVMLKSFKNLFDSVNATRSLIHSLLKMSFRQQMAFTGWAKFSLRSELRRHYEQMVSAFTRVANHDLNLEMFSPEQRTFVHDYLWNRIRYNLPLNFSASLAQFVPNLLVQQIVSFSPTNESEIVYELKENDFDFIAETDSHDTVARNETIDLDSILPKIVGHARIENFFGIPINSLKKQMNLYKITRLPLFIDQRRAVYTSSLPRYLSLGEDGSSSEWSDDGDRKCTVDEKSKFMFCSIPVPLFSSIQNPCLRSIVLNISTKDCLKETVDLSSPHIVKLASNIHAISVDTSLQCFEKGDKENRNEFSNVTKVAIIKTRCNSFISCGTFDFSSVGGVCDNIESYIFTFNTTSENPFKLDKSVNPVDVGIGNLTQLMDIPSLVESALSHKKHLEDTHMEFQSNIHRTIKTETWPKMFIGLFIFTLTVTICTFLFASRGCLKRIFSTIDYRKKINFFCFICDKKKKGQTDDSSLDMDIGARTCTRNETCYNIVRRSKEKFHQFSPFLNEVVGDGSKHYPQSSRAIQESPILHYLPLNTRSSGPFDSSNILSSQIVNEKSNPRAERIYDYTRESTDLLSDHSSITSGEFFEEDHESRI